LQTKPDKADAANHPTEKKTRTKPPDEALCLETTDLLLSKIPDMEAVSLGQFMTALQDKLKCGKIEDSLKQAVKDRVRHQLRVAGLFSTVRKHKPQVPSGATSSQQKSGITKAHQHFAKVIASILTFRHLGIMHPTQTERLSGLQGKQLQDAEKFVQGILRVDKEHEKKFLQDIMNVTPWWGVYTKKKAFEEFGSWFVDGSGTLDGSFKNGVYKFHLKVLRDGLHVSGFKNKEEDAEEEEEEDVEEEEEVDAEEEDEGEEEDAEEEEEEDVEEEEEEDAEEEEEQEGVEEEEEEEQDEDGAVSSCVICCVGVPFPYYHYLTLPYLTRRNMWKRKRIQNQRQRFLCYWLGPKNPQELQRMNSVHHLLTCYMQKCNEGVRLVQFKLRSAWEHPKIIKIARKL
jgi:hypothetical protein